MKITLIAAGIFMLIATLLPLSRKEAWWIRIFDFPRLQIASISVAVLAAYLLFIGDRAALDYLFIVALTTATIYQCYRMFPYTRLARQQVEQSRNSSSGTSISLFFANVMMDNRNAALLNQIILKVDPDVILTAETDDWWRDQLKGFEQSHPYTVLQPQDNTYGMLLYSRLELVNPQVKFLVQDDIPSIHTHLKLPSGLEVELHCLHPRPPFPTEDERSTERDAELILVGKAIKGKQTPVVVMGDLNDVAWSRTNDLFQKISGLLDPRVGRGFFNTFHAKYPFIRFPLDHFFHSKHFRLIDFRRLDYSGSDHFPVFISLSYEPDAENRQEGLKADESDEKDASEIIAKSA